MKLIVRQLQSARSRKRSPTTSTSPLAKARVQALQGQRDLRQDRRERARRGCVHHPVDVVPGQRPFDGTADRHRCAAARLARAASRRSIPYFGYGRQDRKIGGRTPISAKLVANLITTAGANRVLTLELHAGQIQGFFDIPTDNLFSTPVLERDIRETHKDVDAS